jgi:dephospho-CoA kinase
MLREMGFAVLDADSLARQLIEPGQPAYDEVVGEFGTSILDSDQSVDRAKLASIVFADAAKLARLNAILHPRVEVAVTKQFAEWSRDGTRDAAFVEAALLVEAGYLKHLDGLVVTWCHPDQQLERLRARGLSDNDARNRIAAQLPVEDKLRHATEKIDTSASLEETRRQVQSLAAKLHHKNMQ